MDKRVLLTVAVCMGILFVWTKFLGPQPPKDQQHQEQQAAQQPGPPPAPGAPAPPAAAPTPPTANQPGAVPAATPPRKPGEPAVEHPEVPVGAPTPKTEDKPPEERYPVVQPGSYQGEFTTYGAALDKWILTKPQFKETVTDPDGKKHLEQIDLVRTRGAELPLSITFPQSDFTLAPDAAWNRNDGDSPTETVYWFENDKVRIEKHYNLPQNTYRIELKITVENKTDKPLAEHLQMNMYGHQDPNVKSGGMFSQRYSQTEGECFVNGKLKRETLEALLKKNIDEVGAARWIGVDMKYFLSAIAYGGANGEQERCWAAGRQDGLITVSLLAAERKIAPKAKTEYQFSGFFGPKFLNELDDVKVGGQDARLGDAVAYGWTEAIARPMLAVLKAIHKVVPNWAVAIIVLTILLKAVTWWPTQKSMKSMREMAKLKPEVDKLKARYGDDKQKFNVAVMALYKERGINPVGGCLPMLIQMPIYIALYSMLGNSVELYRSSFFWMPDLTANDPYYITPILTGVLMFLQQKFSPQSPDSSQQKAMMYTMPLMFTAFSIFLPAGLTIYILTNTLLTMVQQLILNRSGGGPVGRPAKPAKA